jgi:hypothetical protein
MGNQPGRLQQLAAMALTLLAMWMMLPEHQRRLVVMRVTRYLQAVAARAAARQGRAGMGAELGGQLGEALHRYQTAFSLSTARDRLAGLYERQRG